MFLGAGSLAATGAVAGVRPHFARRQAADGSEIVTFVTDRVIGSTSFTPWVAETPADTALAYSVVEMTVPAAGGGEGTMSIAAEVRVDAAASTVSLDRGGRIAVAAKLLGRVLALVVVAAAELVDDLDG